MKSYSSWYYLVLSKDIFSGSAGPEDPVCSFLIHSFSSFFQFWIDTLLVWMDPTSKDEIALSFQTADGCKWLMWVMLLLILIYIYISKHIKPASLSAICRRHANFNFQIYLLSSSLLPPILTEEFLSFFPFFFFICRSSYNFYYIPFSFSLFFSFLFFEFSYQWIINRGLLNKVRQGTRPTAEGRVDCLAIFFLLTSLLPRDHRFLLLLSLPPLPYPPYLSMSLSYFFIFSTIWNTLPESVVEFDDHAEDPESPGGNGIMTLPEVEIANLEKISSIFDESTTRFTLSTRQNFSALVLAEDTSVSYTKLYPNLSRPTYIQIPLDQAISKSLLTNRDPNLSRRFLLHSIYVFLPTSLSLHLSICIHLFMDTIVNGLLHFVELKIWAEIGKFCLESVYPS